MTPRAVTPLREWVARLRVVLAQADRERGSALVETSFLLVLVMVPLFYLVGTVGRLQAGAYAVAAAAREGGRSFVASQDDAAGRAAALVASSLVFDSHGFSRDEGSVDVTCASDPCLTPGAQVQVDVTLQVGLPLIPDFARDVLPTSITLTSSHLAPVDEFRE